jgi:HEAT repeat protein
VVQPVPQPAVVQPVPQQAAPAPAPVVVQGPVIVVSAKADEYLGMLVRGDDGNRKKAAKELKKYNTPAVVTALIDAMQRDGDSDVRKEAANSLGKLTARDAQPALRQAAREDRDGGVRKAALKSALKIEAAYGIPQ